jgi:hypothetical protein
MSVIPIRSDTGEPDLRGDALAITFGNLPREGLDVVIRVRLDNERRPHVYEQRLVARPETELQSSDARAVPWGQLVSEAMAAYTTAGLATDDVLRIVALAYDSAVRDGGKGLEAVARRLGIATSTAAARVREARAAGYLPPRVRSYGTGGRTYPRTYSEDPQYPTIKSEPQGSPEGSPTKQIRTDSAGVRRSRPEQSRRSDVVSRSRSK